jgi:pimeloyl-ACP methyl ester carboxylesterase
MDNLLEIRPGRFINVAIYENPKAIGTILMIHGSGGNAQQWRHQIAALKVSYTIIVPDLLGHGKSAQPKPGSINPYAFLEFVQDLQILLQKFGAAQTILMGHSYGGALATYLTAMQQDKVKKIILIAPVKCEPKLDLPFLFRLPVFMLELFLPLLKKRFRAEAWDASTSRAIIAEETKAANNNKLYVIKAMRLGMRNIPFVNVSQIKKSALIIAGENDKIISNVRMIAFYENLPNREFAVIDNAAHMVLVEQPDETNSLIKGFLE